MRACLPLLRASLAWRPASKTFELRPEDFPELPMALGQLGHIEFVVIVIRVHML